MAQFLLYFFLVFTAISGISIAFTRDLVYAGLRLFMMLLGVAAIFVFCKAEFLAVSQLMVYIGGVLILLVFGIMLTRKTLNSNPDTRLIQPIMGGIVAVGMFALLTFLIFNLPEQTTQLTENQAIPQADNIKLLGTQTMTQYLLPFEAVSVLLLVALIGAAFIARKD
ncbi:MAG: NADH-quinone oxidoreductase subunit J [Bacteroidia bacterium]